MKNNKLKEILANIYKNIKSFTLLMIIGIFIILVVPALITTSIDCLLEEKEFREIFLIRFENILEILKKYYSLFAIPIIADILIAIAHLKPLRTIDFINNKVIYRDIIQKNSVIGLAYMDNFKEDFYKYITITLLSLQLKDRIQLKDNQIIIINSKDQYALRKSEQFVLNSIKSGKIILSDFRLIEKLAKKEAIEDNLVKDNKDMKINSLKIDKKIVISIIIFIIVFLLIRLILGILFPVWTDKYFSGLAIAVLLFSIPYIVVTTFIKSIINIISAEKSERTALGEEINVKLEGLKNYIKNYSLLHEREKQELTLWNEYLIYSVIFNQNKKIINDIKKLIIFGG